MANARARRTVRLSRALGLALTPKAEKYMERRPYGPGQHGRARKKQDSDYAVRLREKQRLRAQYGIREQASPAPSSRLARWLYTATSWSTASV